jgi:anionic cell wall polymer biosynthesis LytR-Cps2A-Psr (LCP) family protein
MPMRKRKWDKSVLILILIVLIVAAMGVFGYLQLRTDLYTETLKKGEPVSILFAFAGDREYRFFQVLVYHPQTHRGAVLFVPGNVGSIIESLKKVDRIDVLYSPGNPGAFTAKLEQLIGQKINFYIDLNDQNVGDLVDLLGGLELFIPNPVEDTGGEKATLLPSGSVVLDGDKVREFIAYRDPMESEMDWVGREQRFMQALLKRMGESDTLRSRSGFTLFGNITTTNLNTRALESFVGELTRLDADKLIFQRVLGSTRIVDGKELVFPHFEGQLLKEIMKQTLETLASQDPFAEEDLTIAVEVLNGTNVTGLARRAANVFQSFGYEIVAIGNAENQDYLKTVVLDRKGRIDSAERLAELIRCERVYTRMEEVSDLTVDVTVILGKDFDGRYCKK